MNSINASVASVIAAAQAAQAGAGGGGSNNNNNPSSSLLMTTMMPSSSSNATTTTPVSRSNNGISSGNNPSSPSAVAAGSSSASTTTTSAISQHLKQQQQQQKQQHSSNPQQQQQQQQTQLQQIQHQIREQQQHLLLQQELQQKNQQGNQQTHQNQQQNQQQQQQILPQNLQQFQQQILEQRLQQELLQQNQNQQGGNQSQQKQQQQQQGQQQSSLQQEIQKQIREQQQKLLHQSQSQQGGNNQQRHQNQTSQQQQSSQQLQQQIQQQLRLEQQQKLQQELLLQQQQQQNQPNGNNNQVVTQTQPQQPKQQQQQQVVVPSSLQSSINNHLFPIHGHTGLFVNQNVLMQQQNFLSNLLAANTVSSGLTNERLMGLTMEERNVALQELHGIQNLQQQQQQQQQQKQEDRCTINSEYMKTKIQETLQFANLMVLQEQQKQHQSLDSSSSSGNKINNAASNNNNGSQENADTNTTGAYITALQQSPEYVRQLTWLCLRADNYDPSKSAQRLVSFFTFKKRLFGNSLLTKDIKLDDLEADDLDALKDGRVTLLPKKDSAKRSIIVCMAGLAASGVKVSVETWCRLFYYVTMCSVKDELPHENSPGSVFIMYAVGQKEFLSDRPGKLANIWWLLPVRLQATHVCYDRDVMSLFVRLMSQEMESRHLCRFRSHFGSWLECRHSLMTFGIPKDAWFIQDDGTVDLTKHLEWIQEQHSKEQGLATYEESQHKQKSEPNKEDSQKKLAAAASALTTTDGDNNDDSADHTRKKQKTNHTTNGGFSSSSTISPPTTLLSPSFINAAAAAGVGIINGNGINADSSMLSNLTTTNLKPNGKIHPTATTTKLKSTPTQASSHQSNGNTNGVLKSPKSVKKSPATPAAAANNNNGKPPTFVQPQPMDIVMGRGRHPSTSIGHMRLQSMVEERCEEYDRATKFEKTIIANLVVSELQQMGCRFIKQQQQQPGGDKSAQATFVLIEGDEIARDKVSHAFRNLRKKKAGMKK